MADKKAKGASTAKVGVIIGIIGLAIIALVSLSHVMRKGTGFAQVSQPVVRAGMHTVVLEPGVETQMFPLVDERRNRYYMTPWVTFNDVPFVIHWNGGEKNGGFDEYIDALSVNPRGSREPNKAMGKGLYFSFESPPGSRRVELAYQLTLAGQAKEKILVIKNYP